MDARRTLRVTREVVILAGSAYARDLVPALEAKGINVVQPLAGMGSGRRKQWLKSQGG